MHAASVQPGQAGPRVSIVRVGTELSQAELPPGLDMEGASLVPKAGLLKPEAPLSAPLAGWQNSPVEPAEDFISLEEEEVTEEIMHDVADDVGSLLRLV